MPEIPLRPQKPVWWKLILGSLMLFTSINTRVNPAPNLLKANSPTEQAGMDAMFMIMVVGGAWLIISGVMPVWRKFRK